ncbi:hypothetical protein INT46_000695 [Mucor plumbeus]|uniref:Uncharacterized protein n=1 Tax=Mucor plumbeus TaxID=97098 RepID=A0A8H7QT33_9FUNG|nr:hypothetical protein INT46_000695 [Mucor plumbeus]
MRFAVISLAIFMTIVSNYSAEASFENAVKRSKISTTNSSDQVIGFEGAGGHISRSERRSFTSRSRAVTRANLQRRNGSLLPDIVLPSITSAQSAPAPAHPIPQAVSYPASAPVAAAAAPVTPVSAPVTPVAPVAAAPVAAAPVAAVDQNYYTPQPAAQSNTYQGPTAQNNAPQKPAVQNYTPQQPAIPSQNTPLPSFTLPTLVQAPKKKEEDDDEEEEDEDEEDEEDFDADDLVTRRR